MAGALIYLRDQGALRRLPGLCKINQYLSTTGWFRLIASRAMLVYKPWISLTCFSIFALSYSILMKPLSSFRD